MRGLDISGTTKSVIKRVYDSVFSIPPEWTNKIKYLGPPIGFGAVVFASTIMNTYQNDLHNYALRAANVLIYGFTTVIVSSFNYPKLYERLKQYLKPDTASVLGNLRYDFSSELASKKVTQTELNNLGFALIRVFQKNPNLAPEQLFVSMLNDLEKNSQVDRLLSLAKLGADKDDCHIATFEESEALKFNDLGASSLKWLASKAVTSNGVDDDTKIEAVEELIKASGKYVIK